MAVHNLRSKGFTLIELLVVVAIVAILAGLILPVLSGAKFQAKNANCQNNLRQMALAIQTYTSNYGAHPPEIVWLDSGGYLEWDQFLEQDMLQNRQIVPNSTGVYSRSRTHQSFKCPMLSAAWPDDEKRNLLPDGARYGYNKFGIASAMYPNSHPSLGFCGVPTCSQPESAVVAPSEMVIFGDPFARSLNAQRDALQRIFDWRPSPNVPEPGNFNWFLPQSRSGANNHHRKFNKVFCDGHVESEDFKKPFRDSDEYLRRWNIDNQPHRELWDNYQ